MKATLRIIEKPDEEQTFLLQIYYLHKWITLGDSHAYTIHQARHGFECYLNIANAEITETVEAEVQL